jgi:hypothetical protein
MYLTDDRIEAGIYGFFRREICFVGPFCTSLANKLEDINRTQMSLTLLQETETVAKVRLVRHKVQPAFVFGALRELFLRCDFRTKRYSAA